ncbi:MAG: CBS domain-containing protein [Gammaproteobacteria bacterium]|nr:CBS domain-containing protein [Gammaproteobacteria bacterium]
MHRIPPVKSVMTPFPHSVEIEAPIHEARLFMREHGIRHLPVTANGVLVGIVTDRDIKLLLGPDFDYPKEAELTVRDAFLDDPYEVDLEEPLDNVLVEMAERRIGSALVTRKGKLAGVFTVTDACRAFGEHLREQFHPGGGDDAA